MTETSPKHKTSQVGMEKAMTGGGISKRAEAAKKLQIKPEENKKTHKEVTLDSPTSTDMQKSFLIASADPSFDLMAQLKKKKNSFGYGGTFNSFGLNMALS